MRWSVEVAFASSASSRPRNRASSARRRSNVDAR